MIFFKKHITVKSKEIEDFKAVEIQLEGREYIFIQSWGIRDEDGKLIPADAPHAAYSGIIGWQVDSLVGNMEKEINAAIREFKSDLYLALVRKRELMDDLLKLAASDINNDD